MSPVVPSWSLYLRGPYAIRIEHIGDLAAIEVGLHMNGQTPVSMQNDAFH